MYQFRNRKQKYFGHLDIGDRNLFGILEFEDGGIHG